MRLFYGPCQLVQEQKGVLEPPEPVTACIRFGKYSEERH